MSNTKILITDTSVLINFLNINRLDLLKSFPGKFLITEHVIDEITNDFPEQQTRLRFSVANDILEIIQVDSMEELDLFNTLINQHRLGVGECSAISCAVHRNYSLAMEDAVACKHAKKLYPALEILKTQDIMTCLIVNNILSIEEADKIKNDWKSTFKFAVKFQSFSEVV